MTGQKTSWIDIASIAICALTWGTTWFAITLQFGGVDPIISIVYRFGLSAALLFAWCALRKEGVSLTRKQHGAALGVGLFTFALDYAFVYWAELRVNSAVVAVIFAALAFVNLIVFRFAFAQRAALSAWFGAALGIGGVALLSWGELSQANVAPETWIGFAMVVAGVLCAAFGNIFARHGEVAGARVSTLMAWSMLYGTLMLAVFAMVTGRAWAFEFTARYIGSLLYLAVFGSVIAFLLYYNLARRRGYTTASYISALTPPVAMVVSSVFEAKTWGLLALVGVALVLCGQVMLLMGKRS